MLRSRSDSTYLSVQLSGTISGGYEPEMQRKSIDHFATLHGLNLGNQYYTEFITGRSTLKRSEFKQAISDASDGYFDVILVYHTSRFARNRADAIRYKQGA